jgi:hypothetical protein
MNEQGNPISLLLEPLVCSEALSPSQADWLTDNWPGLPDDWSSNPRFQSVGEHTRAYIDRLHRERQSQ